MDDKEFQPIPAHSDADIGLKGLAAAVAGFFAVAILSGLSAWFLIKHWTRDSLISTASPPARALPLAGPVLQISPAKDMAALWAAEEQRLNATEWIDRNTGIARIPIDRAMALLAKRAQNQNPGGQ